MELCDSDVQKKLEALKQMNADEVRSLVLQMSEASKYLVGHNVIHRDIKPANILIQTSVLYIGDTRYKLADFGCVSFRFKMHICIGMKNLHFFVSSKASMTRRGEWKAFIQ